MSKIEHWYEIRRRLSHHSSKTCHLQSYRKSVEEFLALCMVVTTRGGSPIAFRFALSQAKPRVPTCLDEGYRFLRSPETGGLCVNGREGSRLRIKEGNCLHQPWHRGPPGGQQNEGQALNSPGGGMVGSIKQRAARWATNGPVHPRRGVRPCTLARRP